MTQEEAMKILKDFHDRSALFSVRTALDTIIPELKESKDERIRKKITRFLINFNNGCYTKPKETNIADWISWLEKQGEQKSLKVYRVENEAEEKGLWRKFDGTWQPLFNMLTDGKCKDMPMEDNPIYREEGKRWFASAPSREALREWFSKRDLEELVSKGFTITEFEVTEYKKVSDFEYIFTRDNIINKSYLEISDIYPEQKSIMNEAEHKSWNKSPILWDYSDFKHKDEFVSKVEELINIYGIDAVLNTPDYLLAEYILNCLINFGNALILKDKYKK